METEYAAEMEGITKRFPGVLALNNVDLRVKKGKIHALVGENGAGKSTLIKILGGIYQKDEGKIKINGTNTVVQDPSDARRKGISFIHQELNLIPYFNAVQNIFVGRENDAGKGKFLDYKVMRKRAEEILDSLGLSININVPVKHLTAAQQQMVAMARALSENTSITVMDEPTAMLSNREINQLFRLIRRLKRKGVTIIYISHRLEEILDLSDTVTVLKDGKVVLSAPIRELTLSQIIESMVGRSVEEQFPERPPIKPGEELLSVEGLFDENLLKNISLKVHSGEVLGITGNVGSGKSELVETLFGYRRLRESVIKIEGKEVAIRSPRDAITYGLALVPEDRRGKAIIIEETVAGNIVLPFIQNLASFGFIKQGLVKTKAQELVERFRIITPSIDQKVMYLSGGNQQKVALAKWFGMNAKVFILDEPTHGIDVGAKQEIYNFINKIVTGNSGVIFVSSDIHEVIGMADRIMVLRDGEIVARFNRGEATQEKILTAMLGKSSGGEANGWSD